MGKWIEINYKMQNSLQYKVRVVSNFGDFGEIHPRTRENGLQRGDALLAGGHFPILETTRSLLVQILWNLPPRTSTSLRI